MSRHLGAAVLETSKMYHFRTDLHVVKKFMQTHDEALQNACVVLGGKYALTKCQKLLEAIGLANHLTDRLKRAVVALHRLLSLEDTLYTDSAENEYCAEIEPWNPIVADICVLTDQLADLIDLLGNQKPYLKVDNAASYGSISV